MRIASCIKCHGHFAYEAPRCGEVAGRLICRCCASTVWLDPPTVKPSLPRIDSYQWKSAASRQRVVEAARSNGKRTTRDALRAANERVKAMGG